LSSVDMPTAAAWEAVRIEYPDLQRIQPPRPHHCPFPRGNGPYRDVFDIRDPVTGDEYWIGLGVEEGSGCYSLNPGVLPALQLPAACMVSQIVRVKVTRIAPVAWGLLLLGLIRRRWRKVAATLLCWVAAIFALAVCAEPPPYSSCSGLGVAGCFAIASIILILVASRQGEMCSGPICRECGYNLTGNVSGICPECGAGRIGTVTDLECQRSRADRDDQGRRRF
jgi:hypothetical protein